MFSLESGSSVAQIRSAQVDFGLQGIPGATGFKKCFTPQQTKGWNLKTETPKW